MDDRVDIIVKAAGTVTAHRAGGSASSGTSTDATDARLDYRIEGQPSLGESGNMDVANRLRQVLNAQGGNWGPPTDVSARSSDVDVEMTDGNAKLSIQITRAEQGIWRTLAQAGHARLDLSPSDAAARLYRAILTKDRIPQAQRPALLLALDAIDAPMSAFPSVIKEFDQQYAAKASSLHFAAIWLVGPVTDLIVKLA